MTGYPSKKAAAQDKLAQPAQEPVAWAKFLHYPECWDTAAYPTLHDAIHEALAWSGCSVCTPPAAQPVGQAPCVRHCESTAYEIVIRGLKGDIERMKAAQPAQERNFCPRCGKRTNDIHTCTPPQENT